MCFVKSNIAREVGRLVGCKERFWGRRYRAIEILDAEAQDGRLKYLIAQGAKEENLICSPLDWPGATAISALLYGSPIIGIWKDRTAEFHARRRAASVGETVSSRDFEIKYEVKLTPLPAWSEWTEEARRARIATLVEEVIAEGRERVQKTRRSPLGIQKVLGQNPHDRPIETKRSPAPLCHATDRNVRASYRRMLSAFLEAYRAASKRIRDGVLAALDDLPACCFPPPQKFRTTGLAVVT